MRCKNCNAELRLDESLKQKYPEWELFDQPSSRVSRLNVTIEHRKTSANSGQLSHFGHRNARHTSQSLIPPNAATDNCSNSIASVGSGASGERVSVDTDQMSKSTDSGGFISDFAIVNTNVTEPIQRHAEIQTGNMLDLIAHSSPIDYPMCEECTHKLLTDLEKTYEELEKENTEYRVLLNELDDLKINHDLDFLRAEFKKLQSEEMALNDELVRLEADEEALKSQLSEGERKKVEMEHEEKELWRQYRDVTRDIRNMEELNSSLECEVKLAEEQLSKLSRTNIFNLTFHIWPRGQFGTINGFRLGRLPTVPVEWTEINAAWGQTVLLLHALSRRIGIKFLKYELVPYGNYPSVKVLPTEQGHETRELPLHHRDTFTKVFSDRKFDEAMVAFLDCLQQLKEHIEKGDNCLLPYRMADGKIIEGNNEYTVRLHLNPEERWTKAMKFMLMNLKWAIGWVSSQHT